MAPIAVLGWSRTADVSPEVASSSIAKGLGSFYVYIALVIRDRGDSLAYRTLAATTREVVPASRLEH